MSTYLTTSQYKYLNGKLLLDSISSNTTYYLFVGDHVPHSNVTLQPVYDDVQDTSIDVFDKMIFGKKIAAADVLPLIRNVPWVSNTVYANYDNQDTTLSEKDFFVITLEGSFYHIWKCLDNNDTTSNTVPLFADIAGSNTYLYQTSDGYRWKYMATVDNSTANRFKTTDYFPIIANTVVAGYATPGSIDIIKVEDAGKHYNNYIDGAFNIADLRLSGDATLYAISNNAAKSTNGYYNDCIIYITSGTSNAVGKYATITSYVSNSSGSIIQLAEAFEAEPQAGDQFQIRPQVYVISTDAQQTINCVARALVNSQSSNSIYRVEVLNRGLNYRNAIAEVLADITVGISNNAVLRPIISPPGGHGANCCSELYSKDVCISVNLSNTEGGMIPATNVYQKFGIIQNPKFSNVELTFASSTGSFTSGEVIYKINPIRLQTNATISTTNTYVTCNNAYFVNQVTSGGKLFITSNDSTQSQLVTINNVANNKSVNLSSNSLFSCTECWIYQPNISATATCNVISNSTVISINSAFGVFSSGDMVVGNSSGTSAIIGSAARNGVTKTFNTFIQAYKYNVTVSSGSFQENEIVRSTANNDVFAYVHSVTGSGTLTMYLTEFSGGKFNVGDQIFGVSSNTVGNTVASFPQELEYNSGIVLYVENIDPVTRQANQNETINLILNF